MNLHELDHETPGGVYLCQVSETVSCGACCGLYNVAETSRDSLHDRLFRRTERFATVPRTVSAITDFEAETLSLESAERPLPEFHHCPFIGLIGERRSRVGCLLHPLADGNDGTDFRGLSYYGGMACRGYFCPSCREMPVRIKRSLRAVARDWYLYGMMVTENRLLTALVEAAESRAGRRIHSTALAEDPRQAEAFRGLLRLKRDWPFRTESAHRVHYFFKDGLHPRPTVSPGRFGEEGSDWTPILRELGTGFDGLADAQRAQYRIAAVVAALGDALRT